MSETLKPPRLASLVLMLGLLSACAIKPIIPPPLGAELPARPANAASDVASRAETEVLKLPSPQAAKPLVKPEPPLPTAAPIKGDAALNLEQVSLGHFAQLVFADLLKRNVNVDPQVMARRDLITFRSGGAQSPEALANAATLLLKSHGVSVIDAGGLVRIVPDSGNLGTLPEIRRGLALPDTPLPLRPIFHLVDLQAVRTGDVMDWLKTMFGERVKTQADNTRNAILLSGTADNVQAALEAIRMLDQPSMAGGLSVAVRPVYGSADELARRMVEVLLAQGYAVQPLGTATTIRYPIVVLPVGGLNAVYVFARGQEVLDHVVSVARSLDQPNPRGVGKNFFSYAVRHKDAQMLAETLSQLLTGTRITAGAAPAAAPTQGGAVPAATVAQTPGVVVDRSTNTLIFQSQQDEVSQILALLQSLDRPSKSALIEVTVAELSVGDSANLGIQWSFNDNGSLGGYGSGGLGVSGAIARAADTFTYSVLNNAGNVKASLSAFAEASRATILSSPRVLARNGETSVIQVGTDVPVLTSVLGTNTTSGSGAAQVLQTVQYRNTGVILKVKPVIHSGDQIDIDVIQEVSDVVPQQTGVGSSPIFSSRKLDTKLTLRSGATVVLGGLISETGSRSNGGVPFLKDIPLIGGLFGKQEKKAGKREMIVLITPYVVNDSYEAEALTEAFRKRLGPWAERQDPTPKP